MRKWGDWELVDKPQFMLVNKAHSYDIAMSEASSSAQILDWIFQLHQKRWMTPESVHDLLSAFTDILDPQANFCSMGIERNGNAERLTQQYWDNPDPFGFAADEAGL